MASQLPVELEDIVLPGNAAWWPLPLGWWLVMLILLGILSIAVISYRHYRRNQYRRVALQLLQQALNDWQQHQDTSLAITTMLSLLKRTAVTAYGRDSGALSGNRWLAFLKQQISASQFDQQFEQLVLTEQYQTQPQADIPTLYQQCCHWVKRHRSPKIRGQH